MSHQKEALGSIREDVVWEWAELSPTAIPQGRMELTVFWYHSQGLWSAHTQPQCLSLHPMALVTSPVIRMVEEAGPVILSPS